MRNTRLHYLKRGKGVPGGFRAGIALHGHTLHSREHLLLLRGYRQHYRILPAVLRIAQWPHRRATGEPFALERAFWTPPLEPHQAVAVEAARIAGMGLSAMVSLTDHDSIAAGLAMAEVAGPHRTPVSVEWTVPFGPTFFHAGVHNLPAARAAAVFAELAAYTRRPDAARLAGLLDWLNEDRGVLVVLNHPMWDEGEVGEEAHAETAHAMLQRHGRWFHALEVNGLRSWAENSRTLELAAAHGMAAVSGGDRHGAEPGVCINLTRAETFAEFVAEIREGGRSEVAFLPQYREPLRLRWLETARDVLRYYPEAAPERRRWTGRFFYQCADGIARPLSQLWGHAETAPLETVISLVRLMGRPGLRRAMRLAFAGQTV